jgi:ATP/maltotriose-dependent transcriptional regulator MalT
MQPGYVSPVFVGRGAELETLLNALQSAVAGEPAVVLVGGEAGVGKTRLVEEAAARARQDGARVLTGSCIEFGGEGLPLSPIVDALRSLLRVMDPDELDVVLGPARRELARLLPELDPDAALSTAPAGEEGNMRLLELVFGVIQRLALDRPLMLVIEDLHWADRSTLDLAALLVRGLRGVRVLLVLTFRSDEIHRSHPLRPLVGGWERVRSVRRIELKRFTREEATRLLEAILGKPPTRSMVELLYERSEGNAFLIEEILAAIQAGAGPDELPVTLRDVLLARAERLSPDTQRLLRIAAAAGTSVPDRLLGAVAGLEEATLDTALREAIEHHVLTVDESDHGYRFRHELTRDAIYTDALPRERVRIHAAYAQALSGEPALAGSAAAAAAALALHSAAAHDVPRALVASVDAARLSAAYAPAEALRHLERALELWPSVPDAAERCGIDLVEVLRLAGVSAYAAGDMDRSLALLDEALAEFGEDGAAERLALLLAAKATTLQDLDREGEAKAALERAASMLPVQPPTVARAAVLLSLATLWMLDLRPEAWRTLAEQALEAARAAVAREHEAAAMIILGVALAYGEEDDRGILGARAGIELAETLDDPAIAVRGYLNLSDALEMLGRHQDAVDAAGRGLELAGQAGLRRHPYGVYLVANCAESLLSLGRWSEAERLLTEGLESGTSGPAVLSALAMLRARLRALQGRYDDAARDLEAAQPAMSSTETRQWSLPWVFNVALLAVGRRDVHQARLVIREVFGPHGPEAHPRYTWPLIWLGLRIEAETEEPDRELVATLEAEAVRLTAYRSPELTYRALATAETVRAAGGPADWSVAVAAARAQGDPHLLAYALLRHAEAAGDREALQESARLAAQLGAAPLLAEAEAQARRIRVRLPDAVSPARPAEPTADAFGLTEREREVLELVAAGRSNPQIAAELFISPKTASVHVSNIISKLNVSSRGEAAAVAHRLLKTP